MKNRGHGKHKGLAVFNFNGLTQKEKDKVIEKVGKACKNALSRTPPVCRIKIANQRFLFIYASPPASIKAKVSNGDFYAINLDNPLGHGTYGEVYEAYRVMVDEKLNVNEHAQLAQQLFDVQPFIVKYLKQFPREDEYIAPESVTEEIEWQSKYYKTQYLMDTETGLPAVVKPRGKESAYISVMPFIPGKDLRHGFYESQTKEDDFLKRHTLQQRVNILAEIAMAFNVMHHNTPSTGPALVMRDIKPENIRLHHENEVAYVSPIDFGLAIEDTSGDGLSHFEIDYPCGTPAYVAPEIIQYKCGTKSDIYSLTPLVIRLLGGKHPTLEKDKQYAKNANDIKAVTDIPYNVDGLCEEFDAFFSTLDLCTNELENIKAQCNPLKEAIGKFVDLMQHTEYDHRPGPKEFLRFYVSLNNYFKTLDYLQSSDGLKLDQKSRHGHLKYMSKCINHIENLSIGEEYVFPSDVKAHKKHGNEDEIIIIPDYSPIISHRKKIQLLTEVKLYATSELNNTNQLTHAKAILARAFINTLMDGGVDITLADMQHYTTSLQLLNYALEEIAEGKNANEFFGPMHNAINNKVLYELALTELFKELKEGTKPLNCDKEKIQNPNQNITRDPNVWVTLLSKAKKIQDRKEKNPNAHVGKKYYPFFSSRLGRAANELVKDLKKMEAKKKISK